MATQQAQEILEECQGILEEVQQIEENVENAIEEECRPEDGNYVLHDNTTAQNLSALDAQVKTNANNIATKAPINSPALTGVPTAPTAQAGTNTTQVATTEFVQGEINGLVSSAPEALDTLKELADALGDDPNFATTMTTELAKKVDKTSADYIKSASVSGKTLTLTKGDNTDVTFTEVDTQYTNGNGLNLSSGEFSVKPSTNVTVDSNGVSVTGSGSVASADTGLISGGTAYTELRPTRNGTWVKGNQTTAVNLQKLEGGLEYAYETLSRQYDQLKKYVNGNYYDYQTDTDSKYTKTVPAGALPYGALEKVGGKTIVWNQMMYDPTMTDASNWKTYIAPTDISITATDNVLKIERPIGANNYHVVLGSKTNPISAITGHKYYFSAEVRGDTNRNFQFLTGGTQGNAKNMTTTFAKYSEIIDCTATTLLERVGLYVNGSSLAVGEYFEVKKFCAYDMTLMFGSGNEPSTTAEFETMFPADVYAFNKGALLSAGVTSVISKDSNDTTLQTYSIPAEVQALEGYGWSAGSAHNYIDFERKVFVKCVASVDMGSLDYTYNSTYTFFSVTLNDKADGGTIISPLYNFIGVANNTTMLNAPSMTVGLNTTTGIKFKNTSYTDPAIFKNAMSGVYFYYVLATPVEVDISAYITDDNLIEVEANGTLEFPNSNGSDYLIPVPSTEEYMIDLQNA